MVMVDIRVVGNPNPGGPGLTTSPFVGMCAMVVSRYFPSDSVIGDASRSMRWTMPAHLLDAARHRLMASLARDAVQRPDPTRVTR